MCKKHSRPLTAEVASWALLARCFCAALSQYPQISTNNFCRKLFSVKVCVLIFATILGCGLMCAAEVARAGLSTIIQQLFFLSWDSKNVYLSVFANFTG